MVSKPPRGVATVDDLLAIPEDRRFHEVIDGELVEKRAGSGEHGAAQAGLVGALYPRFNRRSGGRLAVGWRFAIDVEIILARDEVFRPDVLGWRRDRVPAPPTGAPIDAVPDWIAEILSSSRRNDLVRKKRSYHEARIGHYWILDPMERSLSVLRWTEQGYLEVLVAECGERVGAEPFHALELDVGAIFGNDEPSEPVD